ncbi:AMP-dependent synthetase/ligase [Photobacterium damselae]|uniref:AMP-dependent synthetase/ligase n=1 Tax=Photobacterium damselae TaxID=38293 RepID=UPI0040686C5F
MIDYHIVNRVKNHILNNSCHTAVQERSSQGKWSSKTWGDFGSDIFSLSCGLVANGHQVQDKVAIYSRNSIFWSLVDLSTQFVRGVTVPIYSTNTIEQTAYTLNDSGAKFVFVETRDQLDEIVDILDQCTSVKAVIVCDHMSQDDLLPYPTSVKWLGSIMIEESHEDYAENLAAVNERCDTLNMDDLFTLVYTSGTTGTPKGVMLSHRNISSQIIAHEGIFSEVNQGETSLCFLPLSHVFERSWSYFVFHRGVINSYLDDTSSLREALHEIKPHYMSAVPRVYEKFYQAIQDRVSRASLGKKLLFTWAIDAGYRVSLARQENREPTMCEKVRFGIAERLVLKNLRNLFGGNIKIAPCGGAKLDPLIGRFFHAIGVNLLLGYGMSETAATVTIWHDFLSPDSVGKAVGNCEIKIGEDDEILVRGDMVMLGYHNMPEETANTFTKDGFLKTGDAGYLDDNGNLFITDRIKDLMKTSCGKYIAPQVVEGVVGRDRFIEQVAVIADARKYVSALVVPCFDVLEEYAAELNIKYRDRIDLIKNSEIVTMLENRIKEAQAGLSKIEQIKKIHILGNEFTQDNGELTPTQKLKRKVIQEKYSEEITKMYKDE